MEEFGLKYLSPRRKNKEAVQSINGSAKKIKNLLGRANELQTQENLNQFSHRNRSLKPADKWKINEKMHNKLQ